MRTKESYPETDLSRLWTVDDVATYLGKTTGTVYQIAKKLPHYKIGTLLRFRKEDVDNWLESFRQEPA